MQKYLLAALAATTLAAPAAAVATYSTNGSITLSDPTFNRPLTTNVLSSVGTAVHYDTLTFTVGTTGNYDFLLNSGFSFDTFLVLYGPAFDPTSPLTNLITLNDDFESSIAAGSGFTQSLTAGSNYVAVLTAYNNTGVGNYTFAITGPGVVLPGAATSGVPEPATWVMMTLGFGAMGFAMRRKAKFSTRIRFA